MLWRNFLCRKWTIYLPQFCTFGNGKFLSKTSLLVKFRNFVTPSHLERAIEKKYNNCTNHLANLNLITDSSVRVIRESRLSIYGKKQYFLLKEWRLLKRLKPAASLGSILFSGWRLLVCSYVFLLFFYK